MLGCEVRPVEYAVEFKGRLEVMLSDGELERKLDGLGKQRTEGENVDDVE